MLKVRKKLSAPEKAQLEKLAEQLQQLMNEEKPYKDAELTLTTLSEQLNIKQYLLTKTLNEILHKSFTDYVNEYRVKEVELLISDPTNDKFTLLALAHNAGFNSKSSFNRAVKKHLGIAPSELKRKS